MIFNFSRMGTEMPKAKYSNDEKEILAEAEKLDMLMDFAENPERKNNDALYTNA